MEKALRKEIVKFLQTDAKKFYLRELQQEVNNRFNTNVSLSIIKHLCYDNEIKWKNKNYTKATGIKPLGSERIVNGQLVVKVGKGKFVPKQRYLYEKYHNVKLKEQDCILFLNNDKTDFRKENLIKISRREAGPLWRMNVYSNNSQTNELAVNIAKLKVKIYDKMKEGIIC